MARSRELVVVREDLAEIVLPDLLELDGRQSQETYYQLLWYVGSMAVALVARDQFEVRAVVLDPANCLDALAHPESGNYLGGQDVIYGQDFEHRLPS